MPKNKLAFTLAALVASLSAASARADLLVNGGFEQGPPVNPVPGFVVVPSPPAGLNSINGWVVAGAGVRVVQEQWQPAEGLRSLDLNSQNGGVIYQEVTNLVAGQQYRLTFALSGNPIAGPTVKNLHVDLLFNNGSYTQPFAFDTANALGPGVHNELNNMGWVTRSWDFIALDSSMRVTFNSDTIGPGGPALDLVQLNAVPEASSLILGGLAVAGIGLGAWKRRKTNAGAPALASV